MAKYKVVVEVTARYEYEVEVELEGNGQYRTAEEKAMAQWGHPLPDGFQVDDVYVVETEAGAEQTSWECSECGTEISSGNYYNNDQLCDECFRTADRTLSSIKAQR